MKKFLVIIFSLIVFNSYSQIDNGLKHPIVIQGIVCDYGKFSDAIIPIQKITGIDRKYFTTGILLKLKDSSSMNIILNDLKFNYDDLKEPMYIINKSYQFLVRPYCSNNEIIYVAEHIYLE